MEILAALLIIILLFVTGAGALLWGTHGRLMTLEARCEAALSDVDVQLKHRHGLIPNLVETVRGFATHEKSALEAVTAARARALSARSDEARIEAEGALSVNLGRLLTVVESYPNLQADRHFQNLSSEIADCENKIAAARRYHNATVAEYNAMLGQFPANVIAGRLSLAKRSHYDLGLERMIVEDAPTVKF